MRAPPPDSYLEVDGCRLRYRDSGGGGPVALLIHGIGGSLELFDAQLRAEEPGLRRIALDLPGHGLSDFARRALEPTSFAGVCWRFLDALGVERALLAGNSMGGAIAIRMAAASERRVAGLLLLSAAGLGRSSPLPFRLMTLPGIGALMARPSQAAIDQQVAALFHDRRLVTPDLQAVIARNVRRPGAQQAFLATLKLMTDLGGQRRSLYEPNFQTLSRLRTPVIFAHGRQDVVLPFAHSEAARALTPGSRLVLLEDCGHTPQVEKPDAVLALLRECAA